MIKLLKRLFDVRPEDDLIPRVLRYRGMGNSQDGIHMLFAPGIDDLDYELMGADNSCAKIAHGGDCITGEWFSIKKGSNLSKKSFGNSHGTIDGNGDTITESAYLSIPKKECQVSPEEVVWHHLRIKELREKNVSQPDRVKIMTNERKSKPWNK